MRLQLRDSEVCAPRPTGTRVVFTHLLLSLSLTVRFEVVSFGTLKTWMMKSSEEDWEHRVRGWWGLVGGRTCLRLPEQHAISTCASVDERMIFKHEKL